MNSIVDLVICSFYVLASVNLGATLLGILKIKSVPGVSPSALIATAFSWGR